LPEANVVVKESRLSPGCGQLIIGVARHPREPSRSFMLSPQYCGVFAAGGGLRPPVGLEARRGARRQHQWDNPHLWPPSMRTGKFHCCWRSG